MALVDEITIRAKAGRGGDGVVRWLHLKGKEFSGPAGGNGGKGGDVYAQAVRDPWVLARLLGEREFAAGRGEDGGSKNKHGKNGSDLSLEVPVGSFVTNLHTGQSFDLLREGERALLLRGGAGGFGNTHFKSSTNTTPEEASEGQGGEEADIRIELRLIADAGFAGFPNAGKSSLLNALTSAKAKVGDYAFTTLDPNLGVLHGFVLADIPGLIEGAAAGRGLGLKFLRHIRRTRLLIHCISVENENVESAYRAIRKELASYDKELVRKPELVVLTKSDLAEPSHIKTALKRLGKIAPHVAAVSILDDAAVKKLANTIIAILRQQV